LLFERGVDVMPDLRYQWKNKKLIEQVSVLDGKLSPTIVLIGGSIFQPVLRRWLKQNVWIYENRIVYVGEAFPANTKDVEVIDCSNQFLVAGYIEPHVHPFQLYNPLAFAEYAAKSGTTTTLNDNLIVNLFCKNKKAFSLLSHLDKTPYNFYWMARYDSQSERYDEYEIFSDENIQNWLQHPKVIQGGELTGWPRLLLGDEITLHRLKLTKSIRKRIEGHLPGASERTLAKMKLIGVDGDHEAITKEDILDRILQGYYIALRNSSIREDLSDLLKGLNELGITNYDTFFLTSDGSSPTYYNGGVIDKLLKICLDAGVSVEEAYRMATYNPALYYNIDHLHGSITTGKIANINILESKNNPTPVSVMSKGRWIKKDGVDFKFSHKIDWEKYDLSPLEINWGISIGDLQFSSPIGLVLEDSVIMKPFTTYVEQNDDGLPNNTDINYISLIDRHGRWRCNAFLKGFSKSVGGFASSYSCTGDIILIGKKKQDMLLAFDLLKEKRGGMVLVEDGKLVCSIDLPLSGIMSDKSMEEIMELENTMHQCLVDRGYPHPDSMYSLLCLSSSHLPFVRITPKGILDVRRRKVLYPSVLRSDSF
jgi:adenine deaminase